MAPAYAPGALLVLTGWFRDVRIDEVVVFMHHGKEKIKRIKQIDPLKGLFVVGDNPDSSTDSRTFGWIDFDEVVAKVIWPFRS